MCSSSSCTKVDPNTCTDEQQVWNKATKQRKVASEEETTIYGYYIIPWRWYNKFSLPWRWRYYIILMKILYHEDGIISLVWFDFDRRSFGPSYRLFRLAKRGRYQSVWLQDMGNSCKSVFPNTHEWEQQDEIRQKIYRLRR